MASPNATLPISINNQSSTIPVAHLIVAISTALVGLAGILGSFLVVYVIFKSKPLRTPCFQLIAGGAIGSFIVAIHYFIRGFHKIIQLTNILNLGTSAFVCLLCTGITGMFGIPFHALLTCLVGIDRLISLLAPIKYRNFGNRYVIYMVSITALFVLIQVIVGFATSNLAKTIVCTNFPDGLDPIFLTIFAGSNLFYCTANVLIYTVMLICFHLRQKKLKKNSTSDYQLFVKQQSAAMPTVKFMTFLYFVFGILAEILINIALKFDVSQAWVGYQLTIGEFLKACSSLVEVASLMICSQIFRNCVRKLLGMKSIVINNVNSVKGVTVISVKANTTATAV